MKPIFLALAFFGIIGATSSIAGLRAAEAAPGSDCQYTRVVAQPGGGLSGNVSVCKTAAVTTEGLPIYRVNVTHLDTAGEAIVSLCSDDRAKKCVGRSPSLSTAVSTGCSDGPMLEFQIASQRPFKSIGFASTDFATLGTGKLRPTYIAPPACPDPPGAVTSATNVCVVYLADGVFSGGIGVLYPNVITYWHDATSGKPVIRFGYGTPLTVDALYVNFLPDGAGCVGPLG